MKKNNLFVILLCTIMVGSSIVFFAPTVTSKAITSTTPRAILISPSNGDVVSGTVTITTTTAAYIYIDGVRVAKKVTSYNWDTTTYDDGAHVIRIKVRRTNEQITVTVENGDPPPPPPPTGDKFAVIVGISDYKAISDLSYCDEDATDWFNYLISIGYASENVIVLGDTRTNNYPKYDGIATETNIKYHLNWLVNLDCDEIAFISSGHGGGDGNGASFNCAWDCASGESGEDGYLDDYEFEAIFNGVVAPKVFVFMDHCYSGGLIPEFYAACGNALYITTTCTEDGYGWDASAYRNGLWTYFFLEYALIAHFNSDSNTAMEAAFDYALAAYPYGGGDTPQEGDYYSGDFTL